MSFHLSAISFELEDSHILKGVLRDEGGDEQESTLDLNNIIGNNNGSFEWEGANFADSAANVELHREGDDQVPVLRAMLSDVDGNMVAADMNLAERIENQNGRLEFI